MQTTITFADGDQVTSAKLNEIISGLSFVTGDVTGTTLVVTGGKLKVGTITSSEMGALSVATGSLIDAAITTAKVADGAVTTAKVANLAITAAKIANGTITITNLSSGIAATQSAMVAESGGFLVTPDFVKYAPGAAKAYGEFSIATSSRAIKANSMNIQSLTRVDSTHTTVGLANNMTSEFYTVLATFVSTAGTPESGTVSVYDKSATSFKLMHSTEQADRNINFVVFGKYS